MLERKLELPEIFTDSKVDRKEAKTKPLMYFVSEKSQGFFNIHACKIRLSPARWLFCLVLTRDGGVSSRPRVTKHAGSPRRDLHDTAAQSLRDKSNNSRKLSR